SRVLDAHAMVDWQQAEWTGDVPRGATLTVSVRTGSTAEPDGSWTPWQRLAESGDVVGAGSRYLQYRIEMTAPDAARRPVVETIGFVHGTELPEQDHQETHVQTPGGQQ
ncbi:MAG TPA: hypothetical protein VFQ15_01555, partial [Jiangellaceae bacterium]|nr:hypothetical protein [Jiangellaceae bacterium]